MSPQNLQQLGAGLQYGFTRAAPTELPGRWRVLQVRRRQRRQLGARSVPRLAIRPLVGGLLLAQRVGERRVLLQGRGQFRHHRERSPWFPTAHGRRPTANVATPVNGGTGKIYGLELSGQYAFDFGLGFAGELHARGFFLHANQLVRQRSADSRRVEERRQRHRVLRAPRLLGTRGLRVARHRGRTPRASDPRLRSRTSTASRRSTRCTTPPYGQLDGQVGYDFNRHFGRPVTGRQSDRREAAHVSAVPERAVHLRRHRDAACTSGSRASCNRLTVPDARHNSV